MKCTLAKAIALLAVPFTVMLAGNARAAVPEEMHGGLQSTCLRTTEGAVQCWGGNSEGQLGIGTLVNGLQPATVSGLSSGVSRLAVGYQHACVIKTDGSAACWGRNDTGQMGDNTKIRRTTPVAVTGIANAVSIAAGVYHSCALISGGNVKCWGQNNQGQLGDSTVLQRLTPIDVLGLTGATQIVTGQLHSCALLSNGQIKCWGGNADGQLGTGNTVGALSPVLVTGLNDAVAVIAGQYHTCAKTAGGAMKCWGKFDYGQLGNGMTGSPASIKVSSPTDVIGLQSGVFSIFTSSSPVTCALLEIGIAKCWGANGLGGLGVGDKLTHSTPTNVINLNGWINKFTIGGQMGCAHTSSDGLVCWGANNVGQHGAGNTASVNFPQHVIGY